ncbi:hypothetical protein T01_15477 [Trichinella spiralis]|uniref:Uncharacterized protein n=1 Tax=Trichinella spiralis TaxID=6334 RepID=A0A0V1B2Q3_TRISP|nr:hypothetical protein T01_15477 [Trichinella spiralis]
MRYSLKLPSFVQYFVVLGKSIFLHFRSISNKLKKVVSIRAKILLYYKNAFQAQMPLRSRTLPGGNKTSLVLFRYPFLLLKSHHPASFIAISRQIRFYKTFWKVPRQTNAYLPCAYLNTQGSGPFENPLKRIDGGKFFTIIMRYSFTLHTFVQYFVVLGKSIFLHFRSISNKLKKVVSIRAKMCIKSSIC